MSFFARVDSNGIAEKHIQAMRKLETRESNSILRQYKEVRRDLRDRLDTIPEGTFTAQKMRAVLVQVEAALAAQNRAMKDAMRDSSGAAAEQGVDDLLAEIAEFEQEFAGAVSPININAVAAATETQNFLINKYESSIDAYSEDQRARITSALTQAVIEGQSLSEVVTKLSRYAIGEEWKVERLARTELHNIYNLGKLRGMQLTQDEALPDLMKALLHPLDARTADDSKYLAGLNPIVELSEPFKYRWQGKERTFMAPPDRPNDRAILIPYRKAWGPKGSGDSALFVPGA